MKKYVIIFLLLCITAASAYLAIRLHNNSVRDKIYKADYYTVNQIKYGLLSGNRWSYQVNTILSHQIDSFSFNRNNKKVLTAQVNSILNRLLDEVDVTLHKKQNNLKDKIKFGMINSVVDVDKFREDIPRYSNSIIDELDKSKNKDEIKKILKEKVSKFLDAANQDTTGEQRTVLAKYKTFSITNFNKQISDATCAIKEQQKIFAYILIGLLVTVLLLWLYVIRIRTSFAITFMFSVIISFTALFIGISLPMIEIDARIARLDLELLSSHIVFDEQVIFFQTKSILDVIHILITDGKLDSVFVGVLIFLFSVLFPITKLICTTVYLFIRKKSNRFIRYMAFNSGKWSMADVMVVAIFMAYVGFQGILDNQLEDITVHNNTINLITTNKTNLQAGFLIFVAFVIFNLILSEILKYITRNEEK
jgi:hypothetical protein